MNRLFFAGEQRTEGDAVRQASAVRAAADGYGLELGIHCVVVHVHKGGYQFGLGRDVQRVADVPGLYLELGGSFAAKQVVHKVAVVGNGEADIHCGVERAVFQGAQYSDIAGKAAALFVA